MAEHAHDSHGNDDNAHEGLKWIMRAGYGARGVIYVLIGGLALFAALRGGNAEGTQGALATLQNEPMGQTALWAIAVGLGAYMIWRLVDAAMDLEDHGTDAKGIFARLAIASTGVIHGGIGVSVAGLAMGGGSGGDSGAQDWTAKLMQMPMGPTLVAIAAAVVIGAGGYYAYKGLTGKYREHLSNAAFTRKIQPVLTFGLVVHGVMWGIAGLCRAEQRPIGRRGAGPGAGNVAQSGVGALVAGRCRPGSDRLCGLQLCRSVLSGDPLFLRP